MPYGGNDWLALTQETALEPDLPICDCHHHFWDFRTERVPYQRYLLHELADDINSGHNVRSTVFIEARSMYRGDGPPELRSVGEVEFVQGMAAASASGLYGPGRGAAAIIGNADLKLGDRVEPVLEALQAASPNRFRGIRHSVGWDPHPDVLSREVEGLLGHDNYRAGARALARRGLILECRNVLSPVAPNGGIRQSCAGPDHCLESHWRPNAGWSLCRSRGRGVAGLASRSDSRGGIAQRGHQTWRRRNAPVRF